MTTRLRSLLGLLLLWLGLTVPAAARWGEPPSLDPVAEAVVNMDTAQAAVLDEYWSRYYNHAPVEWQLRWHMLRCEVAHLESDGEEVFRQLSEGAALAESAGNKVAPGYMAMCEGSYRYSQERYTEAVDSFNQAIEIGNETNDSALLSLAYTSRAVTQTDQNQPSRAMDDLTLALRHAELIEEAPWMSVSLAHIYFVFGRTFYYLENFIRADEAIQQALILVPAEAPLAWFIRFNYSGILATQERLDEAQAQIDSLNDNPPHFGKFYRGYIDLFRADLLFRLNRPAEAVPLARRAAMDFARVDQLAPYAKALIIEGQSNVMMGARERGWEAIHQAQELLGQIEDSRGDWSYLAKSWRWAAKYHHETGNDREAYLAMEQYAAVHTRFLQKQQASELAQQQQKLSKEVDRHRQRLASSSEAQFQLQQSLLVWRGSTVILGLILMSTFIWRFWPVTQQPSEPSAPEDWRDQLAEALNESRQNERPMAVILARDANQPISRILPQLRRDLRPDDRVLQPERNTALMLLDQATDGELAWRLASMSDLLRSAGRTDVLLARTRVHGFDDPDSLLARLEYELISQSIPNRSEQKDPV
ncbi:hypothetical protein KUV89_12665 [Marinobacter hydrocarbonoclasticus]|nr:hypothetical protein [Marinobacter nauticus]